MSESNNKLVEIKLAIKRVFEENNYSFLDEYLKNECKSDKHALKYGAITGEISSKLNMSPTRTRYLLNKYHKEGILLKQFTAGGCCRWWYYGLVDEIKESK